MFCFVLFVCLFVCDARHAFRDRGSERGVRGVHGKPSTGRGAQRRFRGVPGPGRGDTEFRSIYGPENDRKMGKMAKIREIPQKSHDPNPAEILSFGATDNLLKTETLAKMHQNHRIYFFFFFFSCLTVLLIHLLLEEMHAATLHRTTRRINDIQILKGVCRITVCTASSGLQSILSVSQITFTSLVLMFKFYFFTFYFTLCYWRRCMRQRCTGPLVYTIKSGLLFCFVLFCFVCL